jgi:hypothetical protein
VGFAFIVSLIRVLKNDKADARTVLALFLQGGMSAWALVLLFGEA